jgi:hypothetical protein
MKKIYALCLLLLITLTYTSTRIQAQRSEWVNQVISVSSGKFESSPPYVDYVTVQSYNPVSQAVTIVDNIYTQSAQHVIVKNGIAYVAAQDSIIMYNLDTWQRISAVADSGLSRLCVYGNKLIVSKQWPVTRFFIEILDASNLSLLARVDNISGDCNGMTYDKDTLYVAVSGGYLASEGKMAAIATDTWTVGREINFGTAALGIWDLFSYNGFIYAVCGSPWVSPSQGCITVYGLDTRTFVNKQFTRHFGDAYGIIDDLLYLKINNGIGSFNLLSLAIEDPSIIPDPGSPVINFNSGAVDYVNDQLYLNVGNRPPTFGLCAVTNLAGDSLTSFATQLNAETIALDYRTPTGNTPEPSQETQLSVYPNPVAGNLYVSSGVAMKSIRISDITGKIIYQENLPGNNTAKVDCSELQGGIYFLTITSGSGNITKKFVRQ